MPIQNLFKPHHCRRAEVRSGFTLIEMMIVIGVIAVLAALLFPVVNRVKQGGQRTVCLNSMKQLGLAFQQYTLDHDGRYPGAAQFQKWGNGGHWVKGTNGTVASNGTDGALFQLTSPTTLTGLQADVQGGALYPYVKNAKLYICPSNPNSEDATNLSYSMNCAIAGMSGRVKLKSPSEINLLVDEAYANDGFFYAVNATGSTDALADFHLNSGNILFCDGHVRSYTYSQYPLSKDNGPLKVQPTGIPRFYDAAFGTQGFYEPAGAPFGTCLAP